MANQSKPGSPKRVAPSVEVTASPSVDVQSLPFNAGSLGRIPVTDVQPVVNLGAYPAKAVVDEELRVSAHVFREGHDSVAASVILTSPDGEETRVDMTQIEPLGLDIFEAWVRPSSEGDWTFRVEGWSDPWHTWLHHVETKLPLNIDVPLLCLEGQQLLERAAVAAEQDDDRTTGTVLRSQAALLLPEIPVEELQETINSKALQRAMRTYAPRELVSPTAEFPLRVERRRALFSSWYEFFPRSQGAHLDPETGKWRSGTFASSYERLDAAAAMGFDIVYLPPIHPIGSAFRKGKNNSLTPTEHDPGSPWAIGSKDGGHDAIHPDLGTIEDFDAFIAHAKGLGLEIAMDFALQASPDHPWVTEHPEWFTTRVDGTIAYAENPPKKYQDIYPINFDNDPAGIYAESLRLLKLWISHGVTAFRVDNPHTKPVNFWAWLINEVRKTNPEVIFLAEAFTRPQMMGALGAVGYQQSYTYFTWRVTKEELTDYATELATQMAAYYRPSFWVNTPDINPFHLQSGNPAVFAIRAILAATLSPSWGVYSGFELCEHLPVSAGREEYLDSEKYEYRPRDYNAEPNLSMLMGILNAARREHKALQQLRRLIFHPTSHDEVIAFSKFDGDDHVLVVCSLNPDHEVYSDVSIDMSAVGMAHSQAFEVHDILSDARYVWSSYNHVQLSPRSPAHIFEVKHQ